MVFCAVRNPFFFYLDVELQVLVHGVDVVKDVAGDARDDSHQLGVVQFALNKAADVDVLMQKWTFFQTPDTLNFPIRWDLM